MPPSIKKLLIEPVAKLHGSEKSGFLDHVERPGKAWPSRAAGGLPRGAGEKARTQHDPKRRFCAPKSFATGSDPQTSGAELAQSEPSFTVSDIAAFKGGTAGAADLFVEFI